MDIINQKRRVNKIKEERFTAKLYEYMHWSRIRNGLAILRNGQTNLIKQLHCFSKGQTVLATTSLKTDGVAKRGK